MKRIKWVNVARALAIIFVVYYHVIIGLHGSGYPVPAYNIQHSLIYAFNMPLFFFISGLFASKMLNRQPGTVIKSRAWELIYPYLLWGIIQGSIMAVLSKYTNGGQGWDSVYLLPVKPFGQFWYIYDLFFMILLYLALNKLLKRNKWAVIGAALFLFALTPLMHIWEFSRLLRHFPFYILGTYFLDFQIVVKTKATGRTKTISKANTAQSQQRAMNMHSFKEVITYTALFILLTILSLAAFLIKVETFSFLAYGLLGTAIGVALSYLLSHSRFLNFAGEHTMPIYLWHVLVVAGARIMVTKLLHLPITASSAIVLMIVLTLAGVLIPLLLDYCVRKLRWQKAIYGR